MNEPLRFNRPMKTDIRYIRRYKDGGVWKEGSAQEFASVSTRTEALHTRKQVGWKEIRRPDLDKDGYEFYQFDYCNGDKLTDSEIVGYREMTDDTP